MLKCVYVKRININIYSIYIHIDITLTYQLLSRFCINQNMDYKKYISSQKYLSEHEGFIASPNLPVVVVVECLPSHTMDLVLHLIHLCLLPPCRHDWIQCR